MQVMDTCGMAVARTVVPSPRATRSPSDRAARARLVAAKTNAAPPARFSHAVVARSLEAELGERARTRLHAAAFDALLTATDREGSGPLASRAARLAHHAELAGRTAEARH